MNGFTLFYIMSVTLKLNTKTIRRIRRDRDISQDYMADILHFTQPHYSRIERGECSIELKQVKLIADLLDVHISDILDLQGIEICQNAKTKHDNNNFSQEKADLLAQIEELKTDKKLYIEQIKMLKNMLQEKNKF